VRKISPRSRTFASSLPGSWKQQAALERVLETLSRSRAGLQPILDTVAEAATSLCGADYGAIYLAVGEDLLRIAATSGGSPDQWRYEREHPERPGRQTCVGRVAMTLEPDQIPDVLADPEYDWPAQELGGHRTMLGVPILTEDGLVGVIGLARNEVAPFSDAEVRLVATFADQAALAITNARLLRETAEALQGTTAACTGGQPAVSNSFETEPVGELKGFPRSVPATPLWAP
jgi:two-component system, NtrC family, sensor kinase